MNVYVVTDNVPGDGGRVVGVYATLAAAKLAPGYEADWVDAGEGNLSADYTGGGVDFYYLIEKFEVKS